ncbi:hypothetical protein GCM10022247_13570 [Allokutzneria multivorans]|uniref:Uncharacterized protein n=1 Tax=Allokutzneria multivorans TaxID=1142134 RepID=A0ABP7RB26_9PSEU
MAGKRDPSVVVAIWATVAAIGGALITTGGGLLSGLLSAGPATPKTVVSTVIQTETVTVQAPAGSTTKPPAGAPVGKGLSLRELPAQGTRVFTYSPQTVAGVRYETVLGAPANPNNYRRESYIAPADKGTFRAVIGLVDGAPPDSTGTFVVTDSKNRKVEKTVLAGKTETIESVVGKGQRFSISVLSHTGENTLAWVNPVLDE